jgi:hypothetical protein
MILARAYLILAEAVAEAEPNTQRPEHRGAVSLHLWRANCSMRQRGISVHHPVT